MIATIRTIEMTRYAPASPRRRRATGSGDFGRRSVPHEWQKLRLSGFGRPHDGQAIVGSTTAPGAAAASASKGPAVLGSPAGAPSTGVGGRLRTGGPGRTGATGGGVSLFDRPRARPASSGPGGSGADEGKAGGAAEDRVAPPDAGGAPPSAFSPAHSRKAPHEPQNVWSGSFSWPHFEQVTVPAMDLPGSAFAAKSLEGGLPVALE